MFIIMTFTKDRRCSNILYSPPDNPDDNNFKKKQNVFQKLVSSLLICVLLLFHILLSFLKSHLYFCIISYVGELFLQQCFERLEFALNVKFFYFPRKH